MNINLRQTLRQIENKVGCGDLHRAYDLALKLRGQLFGAIYDGEKFGNMPKLAGSLTAGEVTNDTVVLTLGEALPALKEFTASVNEHWLELIHAAIGKAEQEHKLPHFEKVFVWIKVITPRGSDNARLWDTSNRAVNLIINNLKGIFFEDDNLEHMAFAVTGRWGKDGKTVVTIMDFE